jgi:hypothetical protein
MPRTVKKDANLKPGAPLKPSGLSDRASREWDRLTGELTASQIQVTAAHRATLTMAATIAADIKDAWSAVERDGAYILGKAGLVAHPASKRLDALRRDLIKVLTCLSVRALPAPPPDSGQSLEDWLGVPEKSQEQILSEERLRAAAREREMAEIKELSRRGLAKERGLGAP